MKKFFIFSFILILVLFVLCGCENNAAPKSPWERDLEEHWKTDENGEKIKLGKHKLDSYDVCSVCGCQIYDWGNGRFSVNNFDENGNILQSTSFEADGNINEYFIEYDENGNRTFSKTYQNGELFMENEYTTDSNGNELPVSSSTYYPNGELYEVAYDSEGSEIPVHTITINYDGGIIETTYNEYGAELENKFFSPEGEIYGENIYEYTFLDDGTYYLSFEKYCDHKEIRIFENTYNESGDWLSYTVYRLDTGSLISEETYEYEYDSESRKIYKKALKNGELTEEFFYDFYEDGEGIQTYCSKYIHYIRDQHVNGHYTVTEYDKYGNILSESSYDSLGNKLS